MATKKAAANKTQVKDLDAISMLIEDHRRVERLFDRFKGSDDDVEKEEICQNVCGLLTVNATIKVEIFYPAAREALDDDDLIDESESELEVAQGFVVQLQDGDLESDKRDRTFDLLGEQVARLVEEEESDLFKQLRKTDMDLDEVGEEMRARKEELEAELGLAEDDGDDKPKPADETPPSEAEAPVEDQY